jgi:dolichol kinase
VFRIPPLEIRRKGWHMMAGIVATPFVLYTGPEFSSIVAVCAAAFIVCVELLHKHWDIGLPYWAEQLKSTRRETETFSWASISFLLILFVLAWLVPMPVALAAAAMLALGDGMSALIGRAIGRHKIWYNRKKSWEGSVAGLVSGFVGALVLMLWYAAETGSDFPITYVALVCLLGAAFAMLGESLPNVQDNMVVPVFAAVPMTIAWMALGLVPRLGLLPLRVLG